MPKPISRREMIRRLRNFGWAGPYHGGRQAMMIKNNRRLTVPNPHGGDIDWSLPKRILKDAGITPEEWENQT